MPNHVQMLISPQQTVAEITRIIKSASDRRGQPLWYPESYDHWVRTEREFQEIANYIEHNPVKAGLASSPEAYRWSSAAAVAAPQ